VLSNGQCPYYATTWEGVSQIIKAVKEINVYPRKTNYLCLVNIWTALYKRELSPMLFKKRLQADTRWYRA